MSRSPVLLACGLIGATLIVGGILQKKFAEPRPQLPVASPTPAPAAVASKVASAPTQSPPLAVAKAPDSKPLRAGSVELKADAQGHFRAPVDLNGRNVMMLVDTGATTLTLTHEDARKAALIVSAADYRHPVNTAGGAMKVAQVRIAQVAVGPITVRDLQAHVLPPGTGNMSLLGMNFLRALSSYEVKDSKMIMRN